MARERELVNNFLSYFLRSDEAKNGPKVFLLIRIRTSHSGFVCNKYAK